jgi:hypothetical protein
MEAHPHFRSIDSAALSHPFLVCWSTQKANFCLLLIGYANCTELVFGVARSDVAAVQTPVHNVCHEG